MGSDKRAVILTTFKGWPQALHWDNRQSVLMSGPHHRLHCGHVNSLERSLSWACYCKGSLLTNNCLEEFWSRFSCLSTHDHHVSSDRKKPMTSLVATELEIITHTALTLKAHKREEDRLWKLSSKVSEGCEVRECTAGLGSLEGNAINLKPESEPWLQVIGDSRNVWHSQRKTEGNKLPGPRDKPQEQSWTCQANQSRQSMNHAIQSSRCQAWGCF